MRIKLYPELADRFINQIAHYTEYNINIMGDTGHIIASSRNPERVGSLHEAAYRMIQENQEMMIIRESSEYFGTKSGVNLLIAPGKQPMGVVGVTGDPEKVREIALIIKMALETMIAYEEQQYVNLYQKSKYDQLYLALFDEKTTSRDKLEILAQQLKFDSKCIRLPVMLTFPDQEKMENILAQLNQDCLGPQDMCWLQNNQHVLIYKKLSGESGQILSSWRQTAEEWLEDLGRQIPYVQAFVGSLQCRLHYYAKGLQHCQWLEKHGASGKILFFADFTGEYLDSLLPEMELYAIYNVYDRNLDEDFKQSFLQIVDSLRGSNYNLVTTATLIQPMIAVSGANPIIVGLAVCLGGLGICLPTDGAFWQVKEFNGLTMKETFVAHTGGNLIACIVGFVTLCILAACSGFLPGLA